MRWEGRETRGGKMNKDECNSCDSFAMLKKDAFYFLSTSPAFTLDSKLFNLLLRNVMFFEK